MKSANLLLVLRTETSAGPGSTQEVMARLAALIWGKEGRPAGRAAEFLLRARAVLNGTPEPTHDEAQP
jgi:hypothetical protein